MLLKWEASGQLRLECSEAFFQYSALINKLFVFSRVLDATFSAQFGTIDATTGKFTNSGDAVAMGKQTLRADYTVENSEIVGYMYDCYIPPEILGSDGTAGVSVTAQIDTGRVTDGGEKIYQTLTSGIFAFNVNQALGGGVVPVPDDLSALIEQVNAIDDALANLENQAVLVDKTTATATELPPGSQPTVSLTKDGSGNAEFAFGIPVGADGAPGQDGVSLSTFSSGEPTVGEDFTTTPVTATMTNGSQKEFTVSAKNGADGNGVFAAQIENGDLILYMEQIDEGTFGINPDSGQLFAALGADAADFIGTLRTLRRR